MGLTLTPPERALAVAEFDRRFAEMERALWLLSVTCRESLVAGECSPVVETLVWTLKIWWGVQGVPAEAKSAIARAVVGLGWSVDAFHVGFLPPPGGHEEATERVANAVSRSRRLGASRQEYSLVSKVLHWLQPSLVPAYDNLVRVGLGVPEWEQPRAYRAVARKVFTLWAELDVEDLEWIGGLEPRTPLRALDKCFWWAGGGGTGRAVLIKDPWQVVRDLGLDPPEPL